jgi:hypothetical protein
MISRIRDFGGSHRSIISVAGSALVVLALLAACAPSSPPPSTPTIQAAATQAVATVQSAASVVAPTAVAAQSQVAATVVASASQAAPTVAAAQTQLAPTVVAAGATVGAAASTVSDARQVTATALAPTAQVVATQVAPTVQAVGTQVTGAVATTVAESPIQIVAVTPSGDDTTVVLSNSRTVPLVLNGWTLLMGPSIYVGLTGIEVPASGTMTIHFKPGVDTPTDNYLGVVAPNITAGLTPGARVVLVATGDRIASVYQIP